MTTYQFAANKNNEAGLADVSLQPEGIGDFYASVNLRRIALSGKPRYEGQYALWRYKPALPRAEFSALLTEFGISKSTPVVDCTVKVRDDDGNWVNKNGEMRLRDIEPGDWNTFRYNEIVFIIRITGDPV